MVRINKVHFNQEILKLA